MVCLKKLSSKQCLKQHMNVHSGEKPYKCPFEGCDKSFRHLSQLSNHKYSRHLSEQDKSIPFDDFRGFIELVLVALNSQKRNKNEYVINGNIGDINLPMIGKPQVNIKLPLFR